MRTTCLLFLFVLAACHTYQKKQTGVYPDCTSSDVERNDSCLLGMPLHQALARLNLDSLQLDPLEEAPGVLRGVTSSSDSCIIELYVNRTVLADTLSKGSEHPDYHLILDSMVTGLSWQKPAKNKERVLF